MLGAAVEFELEIDLGGTEIADQLGHLREGRDRVLGAMRFGFGVPIRGSLLFLFAMAILYLFPLLYLIG